MSKFKTGDKVRIKETAGGYDEDSRNCWFIVGKSDYDWDYTIDKYQDDFELVEDIRDSGKEHVHYDLIMKWASDPSGVVVEYFDNVEMCWKYTEKPTWVSSCQYRFKPEEPERVFPTTSLTDDELTTLFDVTLGGVADALKAIANESIKRYILELDNK